MICGGIWSRSFPRTFSFLPTSELKLKLQVRFKEAKTHIKILPSTGLCEKLMFLSLITLCEATVLFFELLAHCSPGTLSERNLPLCTHRTRNRFATVRENCKNSFLGGWVGGWMSFDMFLMERDITIFHKMCYSF